MSGPPALATPIGDSDNNFYNTHNAPSTTAPTFSIDHNSAASVYSSRSASQDNDASAPSEQGARPVERSVNSEMTLAPRSSSNLEFNEPDSSSSDTQSDPKAGKRSGDQEEQNANGGDEQEDDGWSYAKVLKASRILN